MNDAPPRYVLSLRTMTPDQQAAAVEMFGDAPVPGLEGLHQALGGTPPLVLEIADERTKGLGGPIDNRTDVGPTDRTDFVDLVFNIGAPQGTDLGGGTFGFGKVATYAMSAAASVLMISRPLGPDGPEKARLIGSAIGDSYGIDGIRYTGRHWWGRLGEGSVLPVLGSEADRLAELVFEHPPPPEVSGTTIMVVAPDLGSLPRFGTDSKGLTTSEAAARMMSALLWSAWPKMVPRPGVTEAPMDINVLLEGKLLQLPDPLTTHPFVGFSHALQLVRSEQAKPVPGRRTPSPRLEPPEEFSGTVVGEAVEVIRTERPQQVVGVAAIAETLLLSGSRRWTGDELVAESMGVAGPPHHLAMMRQAELIVRYDPGPEHPDGSLGTSWGGAFRAEASVDDAFAAAEPPTHDRWVAGGLGRPWATFVRRGNESGPRALYDRIFSRAGSEVVGSAGDLARIVGDHLGGLLDEGERVAPAARRDGGGNGGTRRTGVQIVGSRLTSIDRGTAIIVDFDADVGTVIRVTGAVALAGGGTDESIPVEVLGFSSRDAQQPEVSGGSLRADGTPMAAWILRPSGATVNVRVEKVE